MDVACPDNAQIHVGRFQHVFQLTDLFDVVRCEFSQQQKFVEKFRFPRQSASSDRMLAVWRFTENVYRFRQRIGRTLVILVFVDFRLEIIPKLIETIS